MKKILVSLLFCLSFLSIKSFGFPDMIRHGYVNCTACHISPSGGGVLNTYGRSLSKELLSTWSYEKEENILHGLVDTEKVNDWLAIGGDFRGAQVHVNNDQVTRGKFIKMQSGIELGVNLEKFALIGFIGEYRKEEWLANAPRYYGLYRFTDIASLKVGRYLPNFGINIPDHILATRGPLGFGYGAESDGAEVSVLSDNWAWTGSYFLTPQEKSTLNNKGFATTASLVFNAKNKVTLQYYSEKDDIRKKSVYGINGLLGWSEKLYTTVEFDQSSTELNSSTTVTKGNYITHKSGYELTKGFHALILNDYFQSDIDNGATKVYKYGPGIQWYPRPHLDIQLYWTKLQTAQNVEREGDYAWMILHYYL